MTLFFAGIEGFVASRLASMHPSSVRLFSAEGFARMTVPQLKEECKSKGIPVSGKKSDLIARLQGGVVETTIDARAQPGPRDIIILACKS